MADGNVIILGKLDDTEFKNSINSLVDLIKKKTTEMAGSFDDAITKMSDSIKNIGTVSERSTQQSRKRTESLKEEAQAVKETTESYDKIQQAIDKVVTKQPTLKDIYLKNQANELAQQIREAEAALERAVAGRVSDLTQKLENAKQKLNELFVKLNQEQENARQNGTLGMPYNAGISRVQQQIDYTRKHIEELNQKIAEAPQFFDKQAQSIEQLRAKHEGVLTLMREETQVQQQEVSTANEQVHQEEKKTQAAQQYTEEIKRQAQLLRDNALMQSQGYVDIRSKHGSVSMRVHADSETLSIEEQLVEFYKEEDRLLGHQVTARQQATVSAKEQAEIEERRVAIIESGKRALDLIDSHTNSAGRTSIEIDTLKHSLKEMHNAYAVMTDAEKKSPLGLEMKESINRARTALEQFGFTAEKTKTITLDLTRSESYLSNKLRELKNDYSKLNKEERDAASGKQLLTKIHELENALRQLRQETSRPLNLTQALGLSDKTLDDISYKIQQLTRFRGGLNVETQADTIRRVTEEIDKLQQKQREAIGMNNRYADSNNALTRSFNYMKNRLAFYLTVGASTSFIKQLAEIRGQYEMTERALQVLTDSAERGTQVFQQLSTMALNSPFTTLELTDAAKMLSALGFEADELVGTVKRLGDISAAVGAPIDRIAYALGQVQTYGYLTSLQARTFMRMGIPLVKNLAEEYSRLEGRVVSTADVFQRMKDKAISYNDVLQVINRATDEGGRFFDYQAKVADTLHVQLSNLNLAWQNMLNKIGKSNQGMIAAPIKMLRTLFSNWEGISNAIASGVIGVGFAALVKYLWHVVAGAKAATAAGRAFGVTITRSISNVAKGIASIFTSGTFWFNMIFVAITSLLLHIGDVERATRKLNNAIRENAEETTKNLESFLEQNKQLENSLYKTTTTKDKNGKEIKTTVKVDIDTNEAQKAWDAIRNEIENSSSQSTQLISELLKIDDINERVRKGFDYVRQIKESHSALKELKDDTIKIEQDSWMWGFFGEGMKSDLKDMLEGFGKIKDIVGDDIPRMLTILSNKFTTVGNDGNSLVGLFKNDLVEFEEEVQTTTLSIAKFLETNTIDFNVTSKIFNAEDFENSLVSAMEQAKAIVNKAAQEEELTAEETYYLRRTVNEQLYDHFVYLLNMRIAKSEGAEREIAQQQLQIFQDTWDVNSVSFDRFVEWMKNTHTTAVIDMFNDLTENGTKAFNLTGEEGQKKINELLESFKENNLLAYLDLKDKVGLANMLQIVIPVLFDIQSNTDWIEKDFRGHMEATSKRLQESQKELADINRALETGINKQNKKITEDERASLERRKKNLQQMIQQDQDELNKFNYESDAAERNRLKEQNHAAVEARKAKKKADREAKAAKKKAESEARKAKAAAERAERERLRKQREEEQELATALRDEITIVDKLRKTYEKLRKEGVSKERIGNNLFLQYDETIKDLNKSLNKFGLEGFDVWDIINPETKDIKQGNQVFDFFEKQIKALKASGRFTRNALKPLEEELLKLWEEVESKAMSGIFESLKEHITDIGAGYDLALEVEESPELADLLTSMMRIDVTDLLKDVPKTLREYTDKVNDVIDVAMRAYYANMDRALDKKDIDVKIESIFGKDAFNILDKATFEKIREELGVESDLFKEIEKLRNDLINKNKKYFADVEKTYNDYLKNHGDFADKIREIEDKKYDDLRKLDDAYSKKGLKNSYDYSRKRKAIIQSEKEAIQKLKFEEFKDSETYLLLFDDLEHVSSTTMTMIINKLHDMRKELSDLDPSELKKLAEYEEKLRSQMLKRNPFKDFKKDLKEYIRLQKNRQKIEKAALDADEAVENQQKIVAALGDQAEEAKNNLGVQSQVYKFKEKQVEIEMQRLKLLKKNKDLADEELRKLAQSEVEMRQRAAGLAEYLGYAKQGTEALLAMAEASNNIDFQKSAEALDDVVGNLQAAAQGYAQGGWVGAVAAGVSDLVPKLIKWANSETKIDRAIQRSEREVKRLENSLKNLEDTASNAYGAYTIATQNAVIANKELQLAELQRQLRLEQSRKRKKQDKDKIADLKGQIIDLRNEIKNASADVVNNLLDISSAGDWAENLVQSIIDAFKQGEDAMDKFSDSWDDMIDHMMMKWLVSNFIQKWWDNVLLNLKDIEERYTKELAEEKAKTKAEYDNLTLMSGYTEDARLGFMNVFYRYENGLLKETEAGKDFLKYLQEHGRSESVANTDMAGFTTSHGYSQYIMDMAREWYKDYMSNVIGGLDEQMYQASMDAIPEMVEYLNRVRPQGQEIIEQLYGELGKYFTFGEDNEKQLSQLQQGIQGITEDTAGALEAYMNGVSQQVYYQTDILTQIRDSLLGFDPNLVMGIQSQILLELQNSYQIQVAIQMLLQGWSAADGNSVKVTLV